MKNLLKLPVLLLAVMLVASCGDSKKEEEKKLSPVEQAAVDGKKAGEMACKLSKVYVEEGFNSEKGKKMMEDMQDFTAKIQDKYGPAGSASDEAKEAYEKAIQAKMDDCK